MHEKQRAPGHRKSESNNMNLDQFFNKTNSNSALGHSSLTPITPPSPNNKKVEKIEQGINITKSYVFECKKYPVYKKPLEKSFDGLKSLSTE